MKIPDFSEEKELWKKGYKYVCGIDEVGRGPWAGPVVAAAVIFPPQQGLTLWRLLRQHRIRDSKQLSPIQREKLDPWIKKNCLAYSICEISVGIINREGIVSASQRAYRECLKALKPHTDFILMDAFYINNISRKNQKPIIKGDQKSVSIAAASIIAKVYRDDLMRKLHLTDPRYHFDRHKGYGTKKHQEAIAKHGLSPHHRKDFVPLSLVDINKKGRRDSQISRCPLPLVRPSKA